MYWISKRKAKKLLQRNISKGLDFLKTGSKRDVLTAWLSNSISILEELFGAEDDICREIRFIEFKCKEDSSKSSFSPSVALQDGINTLRKAIERVEEYGIVRNNLKAHPLWYAFGIPVVLFLASLFTQPMQRLLGISEDDLQSQTIIHNDSLMQVQQEQERLSKIEILKSDLRSWYRQNDLIFNRSFDSVNEFYSISGRYGMGQSIEKIIEFCEGFRLRRDNTIDSFYVRLKALNANISSLKIRKKLPVRIDKALQPRIDYLGIDQYRIKIFRLDTL